jgi:hypothetical protein
MEASLGQEVVITHFFCKGNQGMIVSHAFLGVTEDAKDLIPTHQRLPV